MHLLKSQNKLLILIFMSLSFLASPSWAGRVVKVKGKKVYIILDQDEVSSISNGDIMYLTTPAGKKRALIKIRKMRGNKVIAQLGKGKAQKGFLTMARTGGSSKKRSKVADNDVVVDTPRRSDSSEHSDMTLGIIGSFGTATQNVDGVVDMSGSTMGFKGVFDYDLFSDFGIRARVGLDSFTVSGAAGSTEYETSISYLTVDLMLRYYLYRGESLGFFVNAGMGIYSPMSTDLGNPPALDEASISTTSLLILGGGLSIPFGSWQILLGGDYFMFPPSDNVDTGMMAGKLGVLFEI